MKESDFGEYCRHPFHLKGEEVYIHPDDALAFMKNPIFISVFYFSPTKGIKPMQLGYLWGYDVMLQDDIQILLLAIMEGKRNEKKE